MGGRAVEALVADGHNVVVADLRAPSVSGTSFIETDASDQQAIERAAADAELIMNFAGPYYVLGDGAARAAIKLGIPYVDICDDAEATEELLELDETARAGGSAIVVGAGYSPGILNGLGLRAVDGLDAIEQLVLTWVVGEKGQTGPAPLRHFFYGITRDIPIWRDGKRTMVAPFTRESAEEFPFPDPVGAYVVRDVGHPETVTLPRVIDAKEVRNKGAVLPRQSTDIYDMLRHLDLLGDRAVNVNGVDVVARDFVAQFLTERHNERSTDSSGDVMALGVRATGTADGQRVERCIATSARMTMGDATALPTVAAVPQLLAGTVAAGAHGPEILKLDEWFVELARLSPESYSTIELWENDGPHTTVSLEQLATNQDISALIEAAA